MIEREFVQAGHPFASRCSHSVYGRSSHSSRDRAESPTFLLFLDCLWQVMQQYQNSFEFVPALLTFLFDHAYASEFGTFLYNCEKEKKENNVKQKTVSIWSYLNHPDILYRYINPYYQPNNEVLWPSVAPQSILLWERLYCRWLVDWSKIEKAEAKAAELKSEENRLINRISKIRR
ncbi:unnamed protein product [Soboliphyme baturini]|uniref:Myotubularin phosphatase domain-containing protein n=1 Tax=Soboliphyme baturini TaxID=241478 RepID=A0A183J8M1_9BILA|nr:unnamed protein product [Soboliphyme baturini]